MADIATLGLKVDSRGVVTATKDLKRLERQGGASERTTRSLTRAFGVLAGVLSAREIVGYADAYTTINNRLKIVAETTEDLTRIQARLLEISNESRTSFDASAILYSRVARATDQLGISEERLLRIIETVNKSFAVSGATSIEASNAIRQLSQGLAAGALRGEEFNSVAEQAPEILRAVAQETGKNVGQLREFAAQGGITSELLIRSLENYGATVDQIFGESTATIQQSLQVARNNVIQFIGGSEDLQTAMGNLGETIISLSEKLYFLQNVGDGVFRAFQIAGRVSLTSVVGYIGTLSTALAELLNVADYAMLGTISNDAIDNLRQFGREQTSVAKQALEDIDRLMLEPLAGDVALRAIEKARAAREQLGASVAGGSSATASTTGPSNEASKALQQQREEYARLAATITDSVLTPQQRFLEQERALNDVLANSDLSREAYNLKLAEYREELNEALPGIQSMVELERALAENLDPTTAALEANRQQIEFLMDAMGRFPEKSDAIALSIQNLRAEQYELMQSTAESAQVVEEEMSEFAKQAARNIQDQLGETLKNGLSGDFDSILGSWGNMLAEMGRQAIAARIAEAFDFESILSGKGNPGGGFGDLFGGWFANGGRPDPNKISVVGERGPELFVPDGVSGNVVPNNQIGGGGVTINMNNNFSGMSQAEVKRASAVVARDAANAVRRAGRYT